MWNACFGIILVSEFMFGSAQEYYISSRLLKYVYPEYNIPGAKYVLCARGC